jgi:ABC-type multidrug transport system ATPase subunit
MMNPITVQNVTKSYGPTDGLDEISLSFEPGTVNAVLGPNGSGKTTLFRVLLGLTSTDSGTVTMPDVEVGCGFQHPQYFGGLTVEENLQLFVSLTDASEQWCETLVDRCGLERVRHRLVEALSAGFAKRLDIALALIDRPSVLLLDEPFADIDDTYRIQIRSLLEEYLDGDRICIITTHQFDVVASLLDTITIIRDGRVTDQTDVSTLGRDSDTIEAYYRRTVGEDAAEHALDHVDD